MLIAVLPYEFGGLFRHPKAYDATRYTIDTIAVIGLTGYAFGRPMGPFAAWRFFGPAFVLFEVWLISVKLPGMLHLVTQSLSAAVIITVLTLMFASIPWFTALALLRHGGWLHEPTHRTAEVHTIFN